MPKNRNDVAVEVSDITKEGYWICVKSKNHYISFVDGHPYFLGATEEEIRDVKLCPDNSLRWDTLDVDVAIDSFYHPELYSYIGLTPQQLKRVRKAIKHIKVSEWTKIQVKRFDGM